METSRQQEQQLRRMGREAVTKAIQAANANSGGMRRVTAKVTQVNSDYTVDVDMGDSAYSMPITGCATRRLALASALATPCSWTWLATSQR